jgi:hypothetical protein
VARSVLSVVVLAGRALTGLLSGSTASMRSGTGERPYCRWAHSVALPDVVVRAVPRQPVSLPARDRARPDT